MRTLHVVCSLLACLAHLAVHSTRGFRIFPDTASYESEADFPFPLVYYTDYSDYPDPSNSYNQYLYYDKEEDNNVCDEIYCDEKPCCVGECIDVFRISKLCMDFGSKK